MHKGSTGTSMIIVRGRKKKKNKKADSSLAKLKAIYKQDVVNRHINNDHMKL